jgi:tetratricopeptide (TPR) repeat protein
VNYWAGEQQIRASGLKFRRPVESLQDTNVNGQYAGWFIYPMTDTLPWPQWDWDPNVVFKDMRMVARFGYIGVWHGQLRRPQTRAGSMADKVADYIYKEDGNDWALVAARLEEVVIHLPAKVDAAVELGNAYLRLGERDKAIRVYQGLLDQKKIPVEPKLAGQLKAKIEEVRTARHLAAVQPLRNPWME